jgi:N-dimethylarginine dimethylaminohydrolase
VSEAIEQATPRLSFGKRFLMCPPTHFDVLYEINPWMHSAATVDHDLAMQQWEQLVTTLREAGATVDVMAPHDSVPDLVFTANAGIVDGNRFVPSRFRFPERQPESEFNIEWFEAHGFEIVTLPESVHHEGAGDALPFDGVLVSAYRFRSDLEAATVLSQLLHVSVRTVELADPRLYHLDLTFCPLDSRRALCGPMGWDRYGIKVIESLVPEPLWLDDDETLTFCANSIVVGNVVIMPATPRRVGRQLEAWGFEVIPVDVSEFLKAGGGARCLTLALDVALGEADQRDS